MVWSFICGWMDGCTCYLDEVAKPLDEAERLAEIGGPLELELVDRHPGAYRAHLVELALCHDEPPASYCSG